MGTRAVFTFKDQYGAYSVYKHWDGYPEGAAEFLTKAIPFAWELPRFEADDFAAAFVTANKIAGGGDIRLTTNHEAHGDLDYFYEVFASDRNDQLIIRAYEDGQTAKEIFYGRLKDFVDKYGDNSTKTMWNTYDKSENKLSVEA
jgi:hypothetical protein